jgi:hypothetical protein
MDRPPLSYRPPPYALLIQIKRQAETSNSIDSWDAVTRRVIDKKPDETGQRCRKNNGDK